MSHKDRSRAGMLAVVLVLCVALLFLVAGRALAQDDGAEGESNTDETAATLDDPSDEIVGYIQEMTTIVKDNLDDPDKVKADLKAYIDEHGEAMQSAGDRFEERLNSLSPDEAEAYRETLQRKMEKSLEDFLKVMLDFSERHPEAAKELDEMLQRTR